MGKKKILELSVEQRAELEKGYRKGKSHAFRERCQMMLLKSENRTSREVAGILGCCEVAVNNGLKRYQIKVWISFSIQTAKFILSIYIRN
jgi:hypothetical protein